MNVLVACEYSGVVREAFRLRGHYALSNDLLPADDGSPYHIQDDCFNAIDAARHWDLIIMHPPCTALAVSGNAWYGKGMPKNAERHEAISWTTKLWTYARSKATYVCMENPVGVLPFKPSQYVQPYQLPPLKDTYNCKDKHDALPRNKRMRLHYLPPSKDRWKIRSTTFQGIADAMASQWGQQPLINYGA